MGVELGLEPPVCPISAAGGVSKHKIVNHTDKMLAYKIRSSNNNNYSVNVVYGLIQIGYSVDLTITRLKGPPKADKLVIMYVDVPEPINPEWLFNQPNGAKGKEITGETVIKLSAAE